MSKSARSQRSVARTVVFVLLCHDARDVGQLVMHVYADAFACRSNERKHDVYSSVSQPSERTHSTRYASTASERGSASAPHEHIDRRPKAARWHAGLVAALGLRNYFAGQVVLRLHRRIVGSPTMAVEHDELDLARAQRAASHLLRSTTSSHS